MTECYNKFTIGKTEVIHNEWGVHYDNKDTLRTDNFCDKICTETQQEVCSILVTFSKYKLAKEKEVERKLLLKLLTK